jgi:DNA-binding transcriptional LysR family regulator
MVRYTLKQLTYFLAAAELESVTEAARRLNVSQPSVSAAIAQLEQVLGLQLFLRRHAQGLSLTAAGRRVFAEARNLLAHASELAGGAAAPGEELRGEVDVGCFVTFEPYYLPGLLRAFRTRHPAVEPRLHEGDAEFVERSLVMGALDLSLVYDFGLGPGLALDTLAELPPYALLPALHPLAASGGAVSLAALAREPFVLLDLPLSREYFRSLFLRFGLEPDIRHRTISFEMVRGMVANGHGVGLLNLRLAGDRSYDGQPLACRPLAEPAVPLRIVLARSAQGRPTRAAAAFAACARDYFRAAALTAAGAAPDQTAELPGAPAATPRRSRAAAQKSHTSA